MFQLGSLINEKQLIEFSFLQSRPYSILVLLICIQILLTISTTELLTQISKYTLKNLRIVICFCIHLF